MNHDLYKLSSPFSEIISSQQKNLSINELYE